MNQKKTIDLWNVAIQQNEMANIAVVENKVIIYCGNDKYLIDSEDIEEVNVYKLDHMTFDTLMLRITSHLYVFEIPYYIEFTDYIKDGKEYLIPNFSLKPIVSGFEGLVNWLSESLTNFKSTWLDESKPIIDNTNFITNYSMNNS